MKKNILLSGLVALLAIFSGCEMNEEPKSEASVDMVFSSENGLKTYTYSFYNVCLPEEALSGVMLRQIMG